jgi:hypothetical protein
MSMQVRRCHVCGEVSESAGDILQCRHCKKSLLPFYYFEKKRLKDSGANDTTDMMNTTASEFPRGAGAGIDQRVTSHESSTMYGPIRGLTAYW